MDSLDPTLDFTLERSHAQHPIMVTLADPPYNWNFDGPSAGSFLGQIQAVEAQVIALANAEAATTEAATAWELDLDSLIADARLGTRLGRNKFAATPLKLKQFESLRYPTAGREGKFKQAVAFEAAWKKADPNWTFKTGVGLAQYTARRAAIPNTRVIGYADAVSDERNERALLHQLVDDLNALCVRWYDDATATFAENTVPGQLIRTIPTTYDPNRVPGKLRFTVHLSPAPNHGHLLWRAARGERFYISAKGPNATEFELMLNGVTDKEWMGLGLSAGLWSFQGYATNQHGEGEASEIVQFTVAAAAAA